MGNEPLMGSSLAALVREQSRRQRASKIRARHSAIVAERMKQGDLTMSLTTLTLEIRNDFDDPIKHDAMREAVRIAARDLIATACLLQERQVPEINLYENTMEGSAEIDLLSEASDGP